MDDAQYKEICERLKTQHHYDLEGLVKPVHAPAKNRA